MCSAYRFLNKTKPQFLEAERNNKASPEGVQMHGTLCGPGGAVWTEQAKGGSRERREPGRRGAPFHSCRSCSGPAATWRGPPPCVFALEPLCGPRRRAPGPPALALGSPGSSVLPGAPRRRRPLLGPQCCPGRGVECEACLSCRL